MKLQRVKVERGLPGEPTRVLAIGDEGTVMLVAEAVSPGLGDICARAIEQAIRWAEAPDTGIHQRMAARRLQAEREARGDVREAVRQADGLSRAVRRVR